MIREKGLLHTRDNLGQELEPTLLGDSVTWIHLLTLVADIIALDGFPNYVMKNDDASRSKPITGYDGEK